MGRFGKAATGRLVPADEWNRAAAPVQAWRDGDELVIRAGAPLPPICVFCGATAVVGVRTAINTRGHPLMNLQVAGTRIPVCEDDRRRLRAAILRPNLAAVAVLVSVLLFGTLPGIYGLPWFSPYGTTRPGLRALVLALLSFAVVHGIRYLRHRSFGVARPVRLELLHSRDGFIWLGNADPRCLEQLPPVAPGR